jgi:hypothetical protein
MDSFWMAMIWLTVNLDLFMRNLLGQHLRTVYF